MRHWTLLTALVLSFSLAGYLSAQTTTNRPGAPAAGKHVEDLPVSKPVPKQIDPPPQPPQPDDGKPPKFFDKPVKGEGDRIVFVIDKSGSMDWDKKSYTDLNGKARMGNRMDRAKAELTRSVSALADNFNQWFPYPLQPHRVAGYPSHVDVPHRLEQTGEELGSEHLGGGIGDVHPHVPIAHLYRICSHALSTQ